jgi:hypothetical protein
LASKRGTTVGIGVAVVMCVRWGDEVLLLVMNVGMEFEVELLRHGIRRNV